MKTYIVAEISANHGGSLEMALKTIDAIKLTGADAVKIQTYTADSLTLDCDQSDFMANPKGLWAGRRLYELYSEALTPYQWHKPMFEHARKIGIQMFSTPFDKNGVDLLEELDNPIYKIASPEITDIPLIEYVAAKGKPIIISTGTATVEDIELALESCYKMGNKDVTLLKCTTAYPAFISDANVATIPDMAKRFGVKVGLSDHTMEQEVALAAVALGAKVVEKHFIIDRNMGGVDSAFSINKEEFTEMVKAIRNVEMAIGDIDYHNDVNAIKGRQFCRSLYVAQDMKKGETITLENIRSVRPGYGLHPKFLPEILGQKVNQNIEMGTRFSMEFITT